MKPSEVALLVVAGPFVLVVMGRGPEFAVSSWGQRSGWSARRCQIGAALAREAQLALTFAIGAWLTGFPPMTLGGIWLVIALAWIPMELRHARMGLGGSTGELFGALHMNVLIGLVVASSVAAKLAVGLPR